MRRMVATVAAMKLGRYWLRVANTPRIGLAGLCPGCSRSSYPVASAPVQLEQRQNVIAGFQAHQPVGKLRSHHNPARVPAHFIGRRVAGEIAPDGTDGRY